jgi:hypothetical protein
MQRIVAPGNGVIERWLIKEGEPVSGKPLFILTWKMAAATITSNLSADTVLLKIIQVQGSSVTKGTNLAIIGLPNEAVTERQLESLAWYPKAQVQVSVWLTYWRLLVQLLAALALVGAFMIGMSLYHLLRERSIPPVATVLAQSEPWIIALLILSIIVRFLVVRYINSHPS